MLTPSLLWPSLLGAALLSPQEPLPGPFLESGGDRIQVLPHGSLGRRVVHEDEARARSLLARRSRGDGRGATPNIWRARVRVAREVRLRANDREERHRLTDADVAKVKAAFLEFQETVRLYTGGHLRIDADFAILEKPLNVTLPPDESHFLVPGRERNLGISGKGVDSVFLFFHPGTEPLAMYGGTYGGDMGPDGAGASGLAFVSLRQKEQPWSEVILHEWLHQVEWLARSSFGMPWLPGTHDGEDLGYKDDRRINRHLLRHFLAPGFWRRAGIRKAQRVARLPRGELHAWQKVKDDPWRMLPLLDDAFLAQYTGLQEFALEAGKGYVVATWRGRQAPPRGTRLDNRPDNRLDLDRESLLGVGFRHQERGPRQLFFVRADLVDVYARMLGPNDPQVPRGLLGIVLPIRKKRSRGAFEIGGTATPLAVFETSLPTAVATEIELLVMRGRAPAQGQARGSGQAGARIFRTDRPPVIGQPFELNVVLSRLGADVRPELTHAGNALRLWDRQGFFTATHVPTKTGPVTYTLGVPGLGKLPYRTIVQPKVGVAFAPRSGPVCVVRQGARYVLSLRNHLTEDLVTAVEAWLPPEVRVHGLPGSVRLKAGQTLALPCTVHVEADRPAGTVPMRFIVRLAKGTERLGQVVVPVHMAVGRDFLRLSFEERRETLLPNGAKEVKTGEWKAKIVPRDPIRGGSFLRLTDGGGSRFGRHPLLAPSGLSFDTKQFPYVTFWFRSKGKGRAALNLRVGERYVSVPLVGKFVRRWDDRIALRRADLALDGEWHRVVIDLEEEFDRRQGALGAGNHRISAIDIGDTRAKASNRFKGDDVATFDLDEFAVVRDPEETGGDMLRSWTEMYGRMTEVRRRALLDMLSHLGPNTPDNPLVRRLGAQDVVDFQLLIHAFAWEKAKAELPRKQRGKPAGRKRFQAMLEHRHHLDYSIDELRRLGAKQIKLHQEMLQELAQKIVPGKSWRQVAEMLKGKHPTAEELPEFARKAMQDAIDFTVRNDLVTVPHAARDARIRVVTSGRLSRTYPFGGYGGARPSGRGFTGTYFVSPPADWMNDQQARDRLRGNHRAKIRVVALHEVVPGHHLQTVVHKLRPLSKFRQNFYSTVFGEGWALYCEELLFREGFFPDQETRFAQLQMRLWRAVRIVVDVGLHAGGMTMAEAEAMLVKEVGMDPINAKAEVLRYIDNPTRPMSYLVGFLMIDAFEREERERLGNRFYGKVFRDRLLAFGPVPLPAVIKALRREGREGWERWGR